MASVGMHNDSIIYALFFQRLVFSCHLDCMCVEFSYMTSLLHSASRILRNYDQMRDQSAILQIMNLPTNWLCVNSTGPQARHIKKANVLPFLSKNSLCSSTSQMVIPGMGSGFMESGAYKIWGCSSRGSLEIAVYCTRTQFFKQQ